MSNFFNPQFNILADSLDLLFLVLNPLPTAVTLLLFFFTEAAKEYCSTVKNLVLIPSSPQEFLAGVIPSCELQKNRLQLALGSWRG